MQVQRG